MLLESRQSCIVNAGITPSYVNIKKGACQDDPISAHLFILCLQVLFLVVKANHKIRGMNIFQYIYLQTAYTDDTTFFLKSENSIRQLIETCSTFSQYSCLKSSYEKYKIAGIGVLKSVKVTVCGMKCVGLWKDTTRSTGVIFLHNKTKQDE